MNKSMDQQEIKKFQQQLTAQKDKIINQLQEATHEKSFDKGAVQTKWEDLGNKDEDNAMEVADFQDSASLERNLETSLARVEKALKRIEAGTYEQCEKCGGQIEMARLEAYPEAATCLSCSKNKPVE